MYKKISILLALAVSILTSCSSSKQPEDQAPANREKPNIIFFIADDMYPEMFNCLPEGKGKNLTPNMDRLSSEGTLFPNQYVNSPVCTPSRYNCLTGRYASRATNKSFLRSTRENEGQTVIQWNTFITENDKALPHYLQEVGYTTGMAGKCHVIEVDSIYQFPDYWADPTDPEIKQKVQENYQKVVQAVLNNGFDYAGGIYHDNPGFVGLGELAYQNMDWIAEAGVNFIEQNKDNPFFLYFATTLPHHPTDPEHSWQADPRITANGILEEAPAVLPARSTLPERVKAAGLEGTNRENILWMDDALGALIDKLEKHEILDNTIIFFFNDHGQKAKGALYQGGVKNPSFVWKSGGSKSGTVSNAKVQNIDFAPTILEMAGGQVTEGQFDGQSFKSILDGESADNDRSLFFELGYARAIVKGDYKYYAIRYPEFSQNWTEKDLKERLEGYNVPRRIKKMNVVNESDHLAPFSHFSMIPGGEAAEHGSYGRTPYYFDRDQLYNLADDPNEKTNLVGGDGLHNEILEELKAELKAHLAKMPGKFEL